MNKRTTNWIPAALGLLLIPATGWSHPGHGPGTDFAAFLVHPLSGWDHLLAALAVGLWAARFGGREGYALPAAFLAAMTAGTLASSAIGTLALTGTGIALSLLVLGALVVTGRRLPVGAAAGLVAVFAFWHGAAHGAAMTSSSPLLTLAGLALGTTVVHLVGFRLARSSSAVRPALPVRLAGATIAVSGIVAIFG